MCGPCICHLRFVLCTAVKKYPLYDEAERLYNELAPKHDLIAMPFWEAIVGGAYSSIKEVKDDGTTVYTLMKVDGHGRGVCMPAVEIRASFLRWLNHEHLLRPDDQGRFEMSMAEYKKLADEFNLLTVPTHKKVVYDLVEDKEIKEKERKKGKSKSAKKLRTKTFVRIKDYDPNSGTDLKPAAETADAGDIAEATAAGPDSESKPAETTTGASAARNDLLSTEDDDVSTSFAEKVKIEDNHP